MPSNKLHSPAKSNNYKQLEELLKSDENRRLINQPNDFGQTPVSLAAACFTGDIKSKEGQENCLKSIEVLVRAGANPALYCLDKGSEEKVRYSSSALQEIAMSADFTVERFDAIEGATKARSKSIATQTRTKGKSLLSKLTRKSKNQPEDNNSKQVQTIDWANPDTEGKTLIALAATKGKIDSIKYLLKKNTKNDRNKPDNQNRPPIFHALVASNSNYACVMALAKLTPIETLSKELFTDDDATHALHQAAKNNNTKTIYALLDNGIVNIDARLNGITALHLAISSGAIDAFEALLLRGADPNALGPDHLSPTDRINKGIFFPASTPGQSPEPRSTEDTINSLLQALERAEKKNAKILDKLNRWRKRYIAPEDKSTLLLEFQERQIKYIGRYYLLQQKYSTESNESGKNFVTTCFNTFGNTYDPIFDNNLSEALKIVINSTTMSQSKFYNDWMDKLENAIDSLKPDPNKKPMDEDYSILRQFLNCTLCRVIDLPHLNQYVLYLSDVITDDLKSTAEEKIKAINDPHLNKIFTGYQDHSQHTKKLPELPNNEQLENNLKNFVTFINNQYPAQVHNKPDDTYVQACSTDNDDVANRITAYLLNFHSAPTAVETTKTTASENTTTTTGQSSSQTTSNPRQRRSLPPTPQKKYNKQSSSENANTKRSLEPALAITTMNSDTPSSDTSTTRFRH